MEAARQPWARFPGTDLRGRLTRGVWRAQRVHFVVSRQRFMDRSIRSRLLAFLPALVLLVAAVLVSVTTEVSIAQLTRDTTSYAGLPPYTGGLSMLGFWLWCAAATVCLFSASVLWAQEGTKRVAQFLVASGALTTVLLIDDAFQVHENAGRVGLSAHVVFLFYAVAAGALFGVYRDIVRESEPVLLALAGGLFVLAVGSDVLHDLELLNIFGPDSMAIAVLLEDGLKFLGIVGWLNYYVWTCLGYLRPKPAA
ncbi:MAG: hypothetical protein Rubg2KO_21970 [Rubricoccaceae bacterium]